MSDWKPDDSDMFWALVVTVLLAMCCMFHAWGGVAFWGLGDLGLTISWGCKRIAHSIEAQR